MRPSKPLRTGDKVYAPNSHECALDTLLSGQCKTLAEAIAEANRRKQLMKV